jgi:predicted metalloprotease
MNTLFCVRGALSEALSHIRLPSSSQVRRVQGEMVGLLSAKADKASKAVWNKMEDIWDRIMEENSEDYTPTDQTPHGSSSDIHKVTRSVTAHIMYLWENYLSSCQ